LSSYIDGDLDLAMKQELEKHLGHCEDCTMIVDQTKKTLEIFCDSEPVALPSDVRTRLHEALRRRMKEKPN
jgi:anti-sigma factor RsiW